MKSQDAPFTVDKDFSAQLTGRRLTTTEVLYYMPAHPTLLQSFLWQTLDQAPDFPRIHRFLDFWRREIDAVIHSVTISGGTGELVPARVRPVRYLGDLH
jgi:uncharacterized protein Usg